MTIDCSSTVSDRCSICGKRKGTMRWAADGTAAAHGWVTMVCSFCAVDECLKHVCDQVARLPELLNDFKRVRNTVLSESQFQLIWSEAIQHHGYNSETVVLFQDILKSLKEKDIIVD